MSKELKAQFVSRLKSLAWRAGSMLVIGILAFVLDNATALSIPSWGVMALGLISGEVTKWLNTKTV